MAADRNQWTSFAIKFGLIAAAVIAWSVWDRGQRRADLEAIQASANRESQDSMRPDDSQDNPNTKTAQAEDSSRQTEGSQFASTGDSNPVIEHSDQVPPQNNSDQQLDDSATENETVEQASNAPNEFQPVAGDSLKDVMQQTMELFGGQAGAETTPRSGAPEGGMPLFGRNFAAVCERHHEKGSFELTDEQAELLAKVVECFEETRDLYLAKRRDAKSRDYQTFVDDARAFTNHASLTDIVANERSSLSENTKALWRFYVKSYEKNRSDHGREPFMSSDYFQYLDVFPPEQYKRAVTVGEISPGQLLAIEGQLRCMLYELENIWLADVSVNRVVFELSDEDLNQLPTNTLNSILRPEELKAKSVIPCKDELGLLVTGESFLTVEEEFEPTKDTREAFQRKLTWLSKGPNSGKLSETIQQVAEFRKKHAGFDWPRELTQSLFIGIPRPTYNNPY